MASLRCPGRRPAVVAGPWWLVSGHDPIPHYLSNAGYSPSSGFVSRGATLTPSAIATWISDELSYPGQFQGLVLGRGTCWQHQSWVFRQPASDSISGPLWMLAVWSVLTLPVLSTSSNFRYRVGLPVYCDLSSCCVGSVLGQLPRRIFRLGVWASLAAVVIIGLLFQFSFLGRTAGSRAHHTKVQVVEAGGT